MGTPPGTTLTSQSLSPRWAILNKVLPGRPFPFDPSVSKNPDTPGVEIPNVKTVNDGSDVTVVGVDYGSSHLSLSPCLALGVENHLLVTLNLSPSDRVPEVLGRTRLGPQV